MDDMASLPPSAGQPIVPVMDQQPASEPVPRRADKPPRGERTTPRAPARPRLPKRTPNNELADLRTWLGQLDLGISPAVHVNGAAFVSCVMTVDFGTPRKGVRLTTDQSAELVSRLRAATKLVMAREVKVGVMTDHSAGLWWTTIS